MSGIIMKLSNPEIVTMQERLDKKLVELVRKHMQADAATEIIVRDIIPFEPNQGGDLWGTAATSVAIGHQWIEDFSTVRVPAIAALAFATAVPAAAWPGGWPIQLINNNRAIGFYGIRQLNTVPITTALQFTLGAGQAQIKDWWEVEKCYTSLEMEGYVLSAVVYEPNAAFSINHYITGLINDQLAYLGRVAEPRGVMIMAQPYGS